MSSQESDYFTPQGEFRVDKAGSPTLLNCLMYKMSYYRFGEMQVRRGALTKCKRKSYLHQNFYISAGPLILYFIYRCEVRAREKILTEFKEILWGL